LPTLVGTVAIPYGLISPLAGIVEATLLTLFRFARNGAELALGVAVLTADGVLDELLVLLELPQPATASATPARARIDVLGTGSVSCGSGLSDETDFPLGAMSGAES
jgi:hypothetical protein